METKKEKRSWLNNAVMFLMILIILVFILSIIGSVFNWQGTYSKLNVVTGNVENQLVSVESLFSREGARYIIGNVLTTFMSFTPLVMFLFTMIGVGFAEKTGLFKAIFKTKKKVKKFWLSFIVALVSIVSTVVGDIGFVFIIPLSAIVFLINNRNPIIGIIASFSAMTAGYGINMIITQMDYNLYSITNLSAKLIDKSYNVGINGNIIFTAVCTILLSLLIAFITEKYTVRKAKKYKIDEMIEDDELSSDAKKGLKYSIFVALLSLLFFIYMLIPFGTPLAGLLLDYSETTFYGRVFSGNSYVIQGLAFMLCVTLILCGWIYGRTAHTLKTKNDFSTYLYDSLNNIGSILVFFFFASQLIALFKKTNIGDVFTIKIIDILEKVEFTGFPLMIAFFILVAFVNIFQTSAVLKWSVLAPSIVPLFMRQNISPEFAQAIFRVADSTTNTISPFFPYFIVLIGMLQIYNKNEEAIGIKYTYKLLLPYALGIFIFFILLLICTYIINLPIGVGVYPVL